MGEPMEIQSLHTVVVVDDTTSLIESLPLISKTPQKYDRCTIHRVPPSIRGYSFKGSAASSSPAKSSGSRAGTAYDPKLISIGPFHHDKKELQPMNKVKLEFLDRLIGRCLDKSTKMPPPRADVLKEYKERIRKLEEEVREHYSEVIRLGSSEFVAMMLLDGSFIIEHLIRYFTNQMDDGLLYSNDWNKSYIWMDLLLLENQIPFSILQAMFDAFAIKEFVELPPNKVITLEMLAVTFLTKPLAGDIEEAFPKDNVYHLLHLYHEMLRPSISPGQPQETPAATVGRGKKRTRLRKLNLILASCLLLPFILFGKVLMCEGCIPKPKARKIRKIPSAKMLRAVGMKFAIKKERQSKGDMLDLGVSFNDGVLQIPAISIEESTGPLLQNLIAMEQSCRPKPKKYCSAYAWFMDCLIDDQEDVEILQNKGIIQTNMGRDKEVAVYFNQLCKGQHLDFEKHYLKEVFDQVKKYHNDERNSWRNALVEDYFGNPWKSIALVVAAILLVSTILQTIYTVKS